MGDGDDGVIGLTENGPELLRWMVSGPEIARLVNEFQMDADEVKQNVEKAPANRHHKQVKVFKQISRSK